MPVEAGASDELLQPLFQFLGDFVVLQSAAKPHLEVEKASTQTAGPLPELFDRAQLLPRAKVAMHHDRRRDGSINPGNVQVREHISGIAWTDDELRHLADCLVVMRVILNITKAIQQHE